jgi:predicted enzyme related to lactoylglutathione lyase
MSEGFVWFHNHSANSNDSRSFYEKLLGWQPSDGPPGMTMFGGARGPFAGLGAGRGELTGWVPYVQVADVDTATETAVKLGATLVSPKTKGPAGDFSVVRDPGGAVLALWQKA